MTTDEEAEELARRRAISKAEPLAFGPRLRTAKPKRTERESMRNFKVTESFKHGAEEQETINEPEKTKEENDHE